MSPFHDAHKVLVGLNPVRLTVLAAKSVDYNTAPQHLQKVQKSFFKNEAACRVRMNLSPTTAATMYKVMNLPIFLYCSNIHDKSKLEEIENRTTRIIIGFVIHPSIMKEINDVLLNFSSN